jgi:hypothetical protein
MAAGGAVLDMGAGTGKGAKGGANPLHEVASFAWGTSKDPGACRAAFNQNSSRSNRGGRSAEVAAPLPPAPADAVCVAVFLSKKSYDYYCAKGVTTPAVTLSDGTTSYALSEVRVEECDDANVVLSFARMRSRPEVLRAPANEGVRHEYH